ncbi:M20/M25/M40 family metallo-hydrolase [Salipaludibacillus aurantiacus]|uniref:Arginine utilization protein RocB n=1 Tax=Salipaludibacillus aurantiacus TaxID=1601833 RepID=A0A1H9PHN2_9BACI|nr:M20/M25/M40 family metallo-hydrolase [Salipaludibacillus aurantiacus]SER47647.1 Arginine utilization protein RocB [Salipaludibacillus aurantiacus]
MTKWQNKEQLTELTISLVEYASVTGSEEEIGIMEFVEYELSKLGYFKNHPDHLHTHYTEDGRKFVTALVKSKKPTAKTIILMGHLDVVDIEGYGEWKHLAFRPRELTKQMLEQAYQLPKTVQEDLKADEWLFGRGTMDMKGGVALCLSMIELAAEGHFEGNLLFVGVPDEEVDSAGMRSATPVLVEYEKRYNLKYILCWNTEPGFSKYPGDNSYYIYQGSIGKMLPGFYCYGKEAHVAEPFSGLNGNFMASVLTSVIELNPHLTEQAGNERTPPPSTLMQKDLKTDYSVQIPLNAVSVYNLLTMEKSVDEVTNDLLKVARSAAKKMLTIYEDREKTFSNNLDYKPEHRKINVMTYKELWNQALRIKGKEDVERLISLVHSTDTLADERERTIQIVNHIAALCKELTPMIVLFYAPPYYPPVSSKKNTFVEKLTRKLTHIAQQEGSVNLDTVQYFPGLSDLSYTSLEEPASKLNTLIENMPVWGQGYDLPLEAMEKLNMPVINFGPAGKDPHSWTERLNITQSFGKFPEIMKKGLEEAFK